MKNKYKDGDVVTITGKDGNWKVACEPYEGEDTYELIYVSDEYEDSIEVSESRIEELVEPVRKARLMWYKETDEMVIEIYDREDGKYYYSVGHKFCHTTHKSDNPNEAEFLHVSLLHKLAELQACGYELYLNWGTK